MDLYSDSNFFSVIHSTLCNVRITRNQLLHQGRGEDQERKIREGREREGEGGAAGHCWSRAWRRQGAERGGSEVPGGGDLKEAHGIKRSSCGRATVDGLEGLRWACTVEEVGGALEARESSDLWSVGGARRRGGCARGWRCRGLDLRCVRGRGVRGDE